MQERYKKLGKNTLLVFLGKAGSSVIWLWYILFLAVTFCLSWTHEPWLDELVAWRISKGSFADIFQEMRYQGHFMPWYLLLYPFSHSGCSFAAMGVVSWAVNAIAVGYFLKKAPFAWWAKVAVTVSAPFLYLLPAISRCYVLIPLLIFPLADRFARISEGDANTGKAYLLSGLFLGLMANTHVYMEGYVLTVSLLMFVKTAREWKTLDARGKKLRMLAFFLVAAGLLAAFVQIAPSVNVSKVFLHPSDKVAANLPRVLALFVHHKLLIVALVMAVAAVAAAVFWLAKKNLGAALVFVVSCLFMGVVAVAVYLSPHALAQFWFYILLFALWLVCRRDSSGGKTCLYISIGVAVLSICLVNFRTPLRDVRTFYSEESAFASFLKAEVSPSDTLYVAPSPIHGGFNNVVFEEYLPQYHFVYLEREEQVDDVVRPGAPQRSVYLIDGYAKFYDSDRERFEAFRSKMTCPYEVLYPRAGEQQDVNRHYYYLYKFIGARE